MPSVYIILNYTGSKAFVDGPWATQASFVAMVLTLTFSPTFPGNGKRAQWVTSPLTRTCRGGSRGVCMGEGSGRRGKRHLVGSTCPKKY